MTPHTKTWRIIAGLSGFIAVVMGAVGAHAIADAHLSALAEKASLYQLLHSLLLLWLLDQPELRLARWLVLAGLILFCGSLYLKALTGWPNASYFAPMGGMSFMGAWLFIAFRRAG